MAEDLWLIRQLLQSCGLTRPPEGVEAEQTESAGDAPEGKTYASDSAVGVSVSSAETRRNFLVAVEQIPGPALFDFRGSADALSVVLNESHPLTAGLRDLVCNNGSSHVGVQQLLLAWAKLENSAGMQRRRLLEDIRYDWGRLARAENGDEPLS